MGIVLRKGTRNVVDLMLLPRHGKVRFKPLAELSTVHPRLSQLVGDFLTREFGSASQDTYQALQQSKSEGLTTLLNICSAFEGFGKQSQAVTILKPANADKAHPLDFIETLEDLKPDRFFAKVKSTMTEWLAADSESFKHAGHGLHEGAFLSFKERRYPEGNVQFTFAKTDNPAVYRLDSDVDLYANLLSHGLLEVFPNDVLNSTDHTDPRQAYALRWMSVRRLKEASGLDFNPPFEVVPS